MDNQRASPMIPEQVHYITWPFENPLFQERTGDQDEKS